MSKYPALERLLSDYYHEVPWSNQKANEALWKVFIKNESYTEEQLRQEAGDLVKSGSISQFIKNNAHGAADYPAEVEAKLWAEALRAWKM